METYIALLRGINVGGQTLPMKDLALMFEKCGCDDVKTYIQSGNVVFRASPADAQQLEKRIGAAIKKSRGFEPRMMVLTLKSLERAAAGNPYPQAEENPKSLHLLFLAEPVPGSALDAFKKVTTPSEQFTLKGKVLYFYTPEGFGTSKAAGKLDRFLGCCTGRNWRTVNKLIELAREIKS